MAAPAHSDFVAESLLRYYGTSVSTAKPALHPQDSAAYFGIVARLALRKPVAFTDPEFAAPPMLETLRQAALHFIRRTQFRNDADHYQLLGVAPDASMQAIRENHRLLIQIVHPDRASPEAGWPDGIAARVNRAYFVLKNADSRADYDLERSVRATRQTPEWVVQHAAPTAVARRNRPPPKPPLLPEWLTARVGGFVRRNPALTIFAVLISGCSLAIASVVWLESGVTLKRGVARPQPPAAAAALPAVPQPAAAAGLEPRPAMAVDAAAGVPRANRPAP